MRVLVTGAAGKLGAWVVKRLAEGNHDLVTWEGRKTVDLADQKAVCRAFEKARPEVVIHTAAMAAISECYSNPDLAYRINAEATGWLAEMAPRLVSCSTDLVFDGEHAPYNEGATPAPLSVYGNSKAQGEERVLSHDRHLVCRAALLYGSSQRLGFFDTQIENLRAGHTMSLFNDEFRTPISMLDLADGLVELAQSDRTGVLHLGGPERMSRLEMGRLLAEGLNLPLDCLRGIVQASVETPEKRPRDVSLDSSLWASLRSRAVPVFSERLAMVVKE